MLRYFEEHRGDGRAFDSIRSEETTFRRIDDEDLIEAGYLENRPHVLVQSADREMSSIFFHTLHRANENGHARTVDKGDTGKVDHDVIGTFFNDRSQRVLEPRGHVKIDFALERQNIFPVW